MKKMTSFNILFFTLAFCAISSPVFAIESPNSSCFPAELAAYFEAEAHILKTASPWRSVPFKDTRRVFFAMPSRETWLSGFLPQEVSGWLEHVHACQDYPLYRLDKTVRSLPPSNGLFQPYSKGPDVFRPDDLSMLADRSAYPFVKISIPPAPAISKRVREKLPKIPLAIWTVKVMFHEEFHKMQQLIFVSRGNGSDRTLSGCRKDPLYLKAVQAELEQWRDLIALFPNGDIGVLRRSVKNLLLMRPSNQCFDTIRIWERIEGTAKYFEDEASVRAGLLTWKAIDDTDVQKWPWGEDTFYYNTGSFMARVLDRIDPTQQWQLEVEKGANLDEALLKRL